MVYRILQKEGAQEKDLLGEVIPSVYSEKVEEIQRLLAIHGFPVGAIDGKFGPRVREAIARFQEAKGLKVSRFIDQKTWKELNVFSQSGIVERGQIRLESIQECLKKQGFDPGPIDGKMGPKTREAIKHFQERNSLKVDGRIGPETLHALHRYLMERK